jgi:uncharacterized membrane protein (DUF2068 family)
LKTKRPFGLLAIVFYKAFVAALLMVTAIAIFLTLRNFEGLQDFAESYELEGKSKIIRWLLEKVLNLDPTTLRFSAIGTAIYASLTTIEAVGLWFEKRWAHILVLGLVGISIPLEIYELIQAISPLKLIVFIINLAVFWYLFRTFPRHKPNIQESEE